MLFTSLAKTTDFHKKMLDCPARTTLNVYMELAKNPRKKKNFLNLNALLRKDVLGTAAQNLKISIAIFICN